MHAGIWAGCWAEVDPSQSREVESQLEVVGCEMTGPESRQRPPLGSAPQNPGSRFHHCTWGLGYCSSHFARPRKE